jgi:hypothetical protein
MSNTLRRGGNATTEQPIEETRYGPPQHSTRAKVPEQALYGNPQHETDVAVNADLRESLDYELAWNEHRHERGRRRERPRLVSPCNTEQSHP